MILMHLRSVFSIPVDVLAVLFCLLEDVVVVVVVVVV